VNRHHIVRLALVVAAVSACTRPTDPASLPTPTVSTAPTATAFPTSPTTPTSSSARPEPTAHQATEPTVGSTEPTLTEPTVGSTESTGSSDTATASTVPPCLAAMSLRERLALLVWPAVYPTAWDDAIAVVRDQGVGGVVLFAADGWDADTLSARITELDAVSSSGLVIATDEEGGAVQRLRGLGVLPSQQEVSEQLTPAAARDMIAQHAAAVSATGIDMVLAPVADVVPADGVVSLDRSRFFTGDAGAVTTFAGAYVDAWMSHGVVPVLKHFPGHGSASADTHLGVGRTDPLAALEVSDLVPFRELGGSGAAVMVGHLTVPDLTGDLPATRSAAAIDLVRDTLGYGDALVVSDALGMGAVGIAVDAAAVDAIVAGIDAVIFTDTALTTSVIDALEAAFDDGTLSIDRVDGAARRVLRVTGAADLGCEPG